MKGEFTEHKVVYEGDHVVVSVGEEIEEEIEEEAKSVVVSVGENVLVVITGDKTDSLVTLSKSAETTRTIYKNTESGILFVYHLEGTNEELQESLELVRNTMEMEVVKEDI